MDSKLFFSLCRKCPAEQSETDCGHCEEERMLSGQWTSVELREALKLGYRLGNVYEVWSWPEEQRSKTLFKASSYKLYPDA